MGVGVARQVTSDFTLVWTLPVASSLVVEQEAPGVCPRVCVSQPLAACWRSEVAGRTWQLTGHYTSSRTAGTDGLRDGQVDRQHKRIKKQITETRHTDPLLTTDGVLIESFCSLCRFFSGRGGGVLLGDKGEDSDSSGLMTSPE